MANVAGGFDITGWLEAAGEIEGEFSRLASNLTEAQFHAPPRTGGWSVGHCIEHLVLTGHAFLPVWDAAIRRAPRVEQSTLRYGWWQRQVLRWIENPARLKRKTQSLFEPYTRRPAPETMARFRALHEEFESRVTGSRGLDLQTTKVQSPFASWLRYALGFSFDLALAHERRHLAQARRVRKQLLEAR